MTRKLVDAIQAINSAFNQYYDRLIDVADGEADSAGDELAALMRAVKEAAGVAQAEGDGQEAIE